ncbi:DNA replication complex GINS family protein [Candidatus Woesearchaeota archaeon]|nr:DNA replication complex GINS family protein [Candidatus Woesearchaeota archaeon]
MGDVVITYEILYEILRKEKYRAELQKVDENFYASVIKYLQEKLAILESQAKKNSVFASTELEKTQTQLRNVIKILKELYEKRETKIIQFALFSSRSQNLQDTSTMLPEEYALYCGLKDMFDTYRKGIINNILENKMPEIKLVEQKDLKTEEKTDSKLVLVLNDVPEFVGPDLNVYGPYKVGETQELPLMVAGMLISTGQAKDENPKEN